MAWNHGHNIDDDDPEDIDGYRPTLRELEQREEDAGPPPPISTMTCTRCWQPVYGPPPIRYSDFVHQVCAVTLDNRDIIA